MSTILTPVPVIWTLDGWTPFPTTWTYASAATFTVAGDATAIFGVGTKLKWTQSSTTYYGYVVSSSYSSPNTTVTVAGNAVLNATISSPHYSYASNPQGFPHWFDWTPTWTGFSTPPSGGSIRFAAYGRTGIMIVHPYFPGTSDDTTLTFTLPFAASASMMYSHNYGVGSDNGIIVVGSCRARAEASSTIVQAWVGTSTPWINSGDKVWRGIIIWEF